MAYQGRQPGVGVRNRFIYSATGGQTSFSGADSNGLTLAYADATYVDVFLNGTLLVPVTDYAATTKTSIVLGSGAAASDIVEIVAYDISSIANAVPISGGTMTGGLTVQGTVAATAVTGDGSGLTGTGSPSIDDNGDATAMTITSSENVGIGTSSPNEKLHIKNGALKVEDANNPIIILRDEGNSSSEIGVSGRGAGQDNIYISGYNALANNTYDLKITGSSGSIQTRSSITPNGGIYLGGVATANKLDDYEEGTFTPVLDNVSCSYSAQTGTYTKVGNLVTARFEIGVTGLNTGDGSGFQIGDLPFVCGASGVLFTMDTENSNVITNKQNVLGARPIVSADGVRLTDNGGEYAYNNGTSSSGSLIGMVQYFTT